MKQYTEKIQTLRDYNNSRTLSTEIVDGKTFRKMRRKNRKL